MKVQRISESEAEVFEKVLTKLLDMSGHSRRANRCWVAMRDCLESTGNWTGAPRWKPRGWVKPKSENGG